MLAVGGMQPLSPAQPPAAHLMPINPGACLSYRTLPNSRAQIDQALRSADTCHGDSMPLVREKSIGEDGFNGGLEIDGDLFGQTGAPFRQGGTPEVKTKFGLNHHLFSGFFGIDMAVEASIARLLGPNTPGFDQRLHLSLEKSLGDGWQTGFEAELGAIGGFAISNGAAHTSLIQWRTRYQFSTDSGTEHRFELKLSSMTARGGALGPEHGVRADFEYQYRTDSNILSFDTSLINAHPGDGRGNEVRAELRLVRPF